MLMSLIIFAYNLYIFCIGMEADNSVSLYCR